MANIQLIGNGLRSILSRLDNEQGMHGSMLALWETYEQFDLVDGVLSAVYETVHRGLSVTEAREEYREYKLSVISRARLRFTGSEFEQDVCEDSDIIAQVRWHKRADNAQLPVLSQHDPRFYFDALMQRSGLGRTTTLLHLQLFTGKLYDQGFRISGFEPLGGGGQHFTLWLRQDAILVKVHVYTHDYAVAQYQLAHLN